MLPQTHWDQVTKKLHQRASPSLSWGILAWLLILVGVALSLVRYLANRSLWLDEVMLAQSAERWREGDLLYIYYGARPAFLFY